MASRDYPRLDLNLFALRTILTKDLDPIYCMLRCAIDHYQTDERTPAAPSAPEWIHPWLLAYWCIYSAATACRIVDYSLFRDTRRVNSTLFYDALEDAVIGNWPHGFERRHFRGEKALSAVHKLRAFGTPLGILSYWYVGKDPTGCTPTFEEISTRIQGFPQFGPWISWKICDMMERVLRWQVNFDQASLGIYKDPRKGAALVLKGDPEAEMNDVEVEWAVNRVLTSLKGIMAPPDMNRPLNIQEAETILCKFKAHTNGHYPLGFDTSEIIHGLESQADKSPLCVKMLAWLKESIPNL